jgi:hypothetical protein
MIDKKPFQSKKFIAFVFSMVIITGILVVTLLTQSFTWALAAFASIGIIGICTLAVGYILGIASLEKFLDTVKSIVPKSTKEDTDDTN